MKPVMQKSDKLVLYAALLGSLLLLSPGISRAENWANLPPAQQQLLAPLASVWDKLETAEQKSFIGVARAYPQLPAEKQQRLREQISAWAALTPAQRHRAREKFTAFSKVPAEKREAVKQMVREQEAKPDAQK
ncbi:MAG: hypothetical protein COZ19_01485 [Gallionellaceae bacterium CG_4_10_14_3_um_filter_60_1069]|nr:MAG: hypothetical protein COZ19_01485 [Gallionellaceae bacterium CG_4_10_14_3_um_filter_60_1069]